MNSLGFRRNWILNTLLTVTLGGFVVPTRARAATNAEIDAAIAKAQAFLYKEQKPDGRWEFDEKRRGERHEAGARQGDTFGGFTAMATYALLASGEKTNDPRIQRAVDFLKSANVIGIYALGVRANVWPYLPPSDQAAHAMAEHDAHAILAGMITNSKNPTVNGFWDYGSGHGEEGRSDRFDNSVSQYAVLGLWASALNGIPIDRKVWGKIDAGWKSHQYPDGGWSYERAPAEGGEESLAMTIAGVATLFISGDMLSETKGTDCRGNITNVNIERGLEYVSKHFSGLSGTYGLYGVERIGTASGRKYLGNVDWYAEGVEKLIHSQGPDGQWRGGFPGGDDPVPATAFGLIFLARGRQGIMINKLEYDITPKSGETRPVEGNWNQRPRDVFNLSHWAGHQLENHLLGWQIVSLKVKPDELHDAPILYISGDQELSFSPEEEAKLREFILGGGMILANADCGIGKKAFAPSVEALGKTLFPAYQFRDLPANHLIFTSQQYSASKWNPVPRLRGLSNGVRELIVLIPEADPSRDWQTHTDYSLDPQLELGSDIYLYATDRIEYNSKLNSHVIHPDTTIVADQRVRVARIMVGDNPDPEPRGWERIAALMHNQFKLDVDVVPVKLPDKQLNSFRLAHLTGTTKFALTQPMRLALIDFVHHGGTLVVDAAGGSTEFAAAAAVELKACFGADAQTGMNQPLPISDALFNQPDAKLTGFTAKGFGYRMFHRKVVGGLKTPRLNGIRIANRIGVIFSREDLSAGMVGEEVDGIGGYTPQTATEIMRNIVLFASGFGQHPATRPATGPSTVPAAGHN